MSGIKPLVLTTFATVDESPARGVNMKGMNILFFGTLILILVVSTILFSFPIEIENNKNNYLKNEIIKNDINTLTFEVEGKIKVQPYYDREYPKRYNEKIWEYYDKLSEARDRTFFR